MMVRAQADVPPVAAGELTPTPAQISYMQVLSARGGAPNMRLYSRLKCEGLS